MSVIIQRVWSGAPRPVANPTPVPTPTDASWLNAIEAHFGVTKRATLTGSDDRDHVPRRRRIYRYLRYRNRRVGQEDHPVTRIRSIRPIKLDRH